MTSQLTGCIGSCAGAFCGVCLYRNIDDVMSATGALSIFLFDMCILAFSVVFVYVVRVHFGEYGSWETYGFFGWLCQGNACEILVVYKTILGFSLYHIIAMTIMYLTSLSDISKARIFRESYIKFKLLLFLFCVGLCMIIPETVISAIYPIFFVFGFLYTLVIDFLMVVFAQGITQLSVEQSHRTVMNIPHGGGSFDDDDDNGKEKDLESNRGYPDEKLLRQGEEDEDEISNSFTCFFVIFSILALIYTCVVWGWLLEMILVDPDCHVNMIILMVYGVIVVLALFFSFIIRKWNDTINLFVFCVIVLVSSYLLWTAVVIDDPLQCHEKVLAGDGMHIFTVGSAFVISVILISFKSIPPKVQRNGRRYMDMCIQLHIIYMLCFCYLALVTIDWSVPFVFEGVLYQQRSTFIPMIIHYIALIGIFLVFFVDAMLPVCFYRSPSTKNG